MGSFDLTQLRCFRVCGIPSACNAAWAPSAAATILLIDRTDAGVHYLVIHSGSRNLGKQVADHYQRLAIDLNRGKEAYFARKQSIIDSYKAAGRNEISRC